jgi:predicted amidophosphoribosyltransferase
MRLTEVVRREVGKLEADIVVPVPLHRQRYRERGHNQADLIARPDSLGFAIGPFS